MIDDDDLDRALAALPLEEPPERLHARIMAATAYAPPSPPVAAWGWEIWVVGTLLAVAAWLAGLVVTAPHLTERVTDTIARLVQAGGLTSVSTLLWLAIGASVWWITQLSVPRERIEVR
jgi:hypothetical protein